jgi:hypothetical protein
MLHQSNTPIPTTARHLSTEKIKKRTCSSSLSMTRLFLPLLITTMDKTGKAHKKQQARAASNVG